MREWKGKGEEHLREKHTWGQTREKERERAFEHEATVEGEEMRGDVRRASEEDYRYNASIKHSLPK